MTLIAYLIAYRIDDPARGKRLYKEGVGAMLLVTLLCHLAVTTY